MFTNIGKPAGIYHYVAESSCYAKYLTDIGSPIFEWANKGSFSFFMYKHSNKFFRLVYRSQKMEWAQAIKAHKTWFQVQMFLLGFWWLPITFRGPNSPKQTFFGSCCRLSASLCLESLSFCKKIKYYLQKYMYQLDIKYDKQIWPATEASCLVLYMMIQQF